jgi:phosphatidylglycerol:prolipoprotein diacylglycerol transferase
VGRFIIEFFRGDLERGTIGILSTSQFISIFLFIAGVAIVILRGLHARKSQALSETAAIASENEEDEEDLQ